jgi:hypothetical protein
MSFGQMLVHHMPNAKKIVGAWFMLWHSKLVCFMKYCQRYQSLSIYLSKRFHLGLTKVSEAKACPRNASNLGKLKAL